MGAIFEKGPRAVSLSEEAKRVLQDQAISDDGPGTVLRDFKALLSFVGEKGLKTTGKYSFLPQAGLENLNARMSRPVSHRLKRAQQRSFPHLHGLYLLLRASGLGVASGATAAGRLAIDQETLCVSKELNATERYFMLLESWLVHARPEIIAECSGLLSEHGFLEALLHLWNRLRRPKTILSDDRYGGLLYGTIDLVTMALAELFGWLRVEYHAPGPGDGVKAGVIERLAFGDAMVTALHAYWFSALFPPLGGDRPPDDGTLQAVFQPYFPDWRRIGVPSRPSFREGRHTWRVSLGSAWREIVARGRATLDDLARAILRAFDFDNDHLYCFLVTDTRGRTLRFSCPYEEEGDAATDDVRLGDLPIREGGLMTFHFDYGDDWLFSVKLREIAPKAERTQVRVTAQGGRAPEQYGRGEA